MRQPDDTDDAPRIVFQASEKLAKEVIEKTFEYEDAHIFARAYLLKSRQLERAMEALGYYTNPDNRDSEGAFYHEENNDCWVDYGWTASEALKALATMEDSGK